MPGGSGIGAGGTAARAGAGSATTLGVVWSGPGETGNAGVSGNWITGVSAGAGSLAPRITLGPVGGVAGAGAAGLAGVPPPGAGPPPWAIAARGPVATD